MTSDYSDPKPTRTRPAPASSSSLSSVGNALLLLEHLEHNGSISVTETARLLGVGISSAHRLLRTVTDAGFAVQRRSGGRYEAGHKLLDIALGALSQINLREIAYPHLEELSRRIPAQIWLIRMDSSRATSLDAHLTSGVQLATPDFIASRPLHTLASGKLLLSTLTASHLNRLYPHERLPPVTARSITSKDQLFKELAAVRRAHYAVQLGENMLPSGAIAVSVYGLTGEILGALTVSGPVEEFDRVGLHERLPLVRSASVAITDDIHERLRQR
ncbi:IclR family transcriptional regulator C-terminal domain-containing protein [Nocardioides sp. 31GB23]|uniref:IclR family transcriptional regulator n=1 Tax=Nocardioides sp. 31GB23 TaxID=3156065 RepID=UPI0032B0125A